MTPEQIEAAGPEQTREVLEALYDLLTGTPICEATLRFVRMLDAEAYLDAAMMLLGDMRLLFLTDLQDRWAAKIWRRPAGQGANPALALAAAIARAQEADNGR